jgi:hypothetical protein
MAEDEERIPSGAEGCIEDPLKGDLPELYPETAHIKPLLFCDLEEDLVQSPFCHTDEIAQRRRAHTLWGFRRVPVGQGKRSGARGCTASLPAHCPAGGIEIEGMPHPHPIRSWREGIEIRGGVCTSRSLPFPLLFAPEGKEQKENEGKDPEKDRGTIHTGCGS